MRNLKKILSLVLALMMVLSVMVTASAADFADDEDIEYKEAVEVMTAIKVIEGVDGKFLPKDYLNRAAGAKIVAYILESADPDAIIMDAISNPFTDVPGWAENVVKYCAVNGIIDGMGDGTFLPKDYLTGYAFAKMLLLAMGVEGEYTGSNWKINIAKAVKNVGLLDGLDGVALSEKLTREQGCQMALNAVLYCATVDYGYPVLDANNKTVGYYDSLVEASFAVEQLNKTGGGYYYETEKVENKNDNLLYNNFDVLYNTKSMDDFGNPGTSYTDPYGYVDLFYPDKAMATYTSGFDTKTYDALVAAGYDFTNCVVYNNGKIDASLKAKGDNGETDGIADRAYTGTIISLYNHLDGDGSTVDRLVMTQSYLTEVTKVSSASTDPTKNYITLAVYNPWQDADANHSADIVSVTYNDWVYTDYTSMYDYLVAKYAEDDLFLSYWYASAPENGANGDYFIMDEAIPGTFTGTVTATKVNESNGYNGTFVAGGTTYTLASGYAEYAGYGGSLDVGTEYTFITDANGYVMGAIPTEETTPEVHYAILLDYASADRIDDSDLTGRAAAAAYENVKLFTSEGKVEILGTAFKMDSTDPTGCKITPVAGTGIRASTADGDGIYNDDSGANGSLVQYTLTDSGKIKTVTVATETTTLASTTPKGETFLIKSSGSNYANDETVIFVKADNVTTFTGIGDLAVFIGYANVPDGSTYSYATAAAGSAIDADSTKNAAGAVCVTVGTGKSLPGATTNAQYAVLLDDTPVITKAEDEKFDHRYTWDAVVNGQLTTVFAEGDSDIWSSTNAGKLCTVTFDSKTGAIASLVDVTNGTDDIDQITTMASGYYTDDVVVYIDKDTVFYRLDAKTIGDGTISDITGFEAAPITMPGSKDNFKVYEYFTKDIDGDNINDVVFYFVYQP